MTKKIMRRARLWPKMRTVKSVARKMKGKLSAPQVECTSKPLGYAEGELHEIVGGGNHQDVEENEPTEGLLLLGGGEAVVLHEWSLVLV